MLISLLQAKFTGAFVPLWAMKRVTAEFVCQG